MADISKPTNGSSAAKPAEGQAPVQARVLSQFIRDLSFENPNADKWLSGPGDNPNLNIEVNVNARSVGKDRYESIIQFKASASSKAGVIYELELVYGGFFEVLNMPQQMLEQFLLINCPSLLFPFLRRLIADLTREGGFPPLMLDPIDFAQLYVQRMQQAQAAQAGGPKPKV